MGLLHLLIAVSTPVIQMLLITALGLVLALDRFDLLGEDARKHSNNIVYVIFNPALIGSNLSKTITYESMKRLWFMPLNIFVTFVVGSILAWVVNQITRAPKHLRGLVIGCCASGNMGNVLLIIIPAVCKEKGSPFGAPDVCSTYGMGYAALSMAICAIYLWAYVYNIVRISLSISPDEVEVNASESSITDVGVSTEPLLRANDLARSEHQSEQPALPSTRFDDKSQIAGFVVGLIPQIRKSIVGDAAPLHVVQDTAALLGDGAIPLLTLIMGGNLVKGLKGSGFQKSILVGIVVVKYIAMPLIGIVVVKGASWLGLVHADPLYQFVLLLHFALPPAMNMATITQLFGAGESECSVILLWTYALSTVSLTIWTTYFIWLIS